MIAALRAYGQFRDGTAIRSWLFSIAARKAIDADRVSPRAPVPLADPQPAAGDSPARASQVWDEVAQLPDKQRQAVVLRYFVDLSHREIGELMHTSEAAARRNVFEGLRHLRAALQPRSASSQPAEPPLRPGDRRCQATSHSTGVASSYAREAHP